MAPVSGGGGNSGYDWTRWDLWWSFNREPYLDLRRRLLQEIDAGEGDWTRDFLAGVVDRQKLAGQALPSLLEALEGDNPYVTASALIAIARLDLVETLAANLDRTAIAMPYLAHPNLEAAESAITALGILADPAAAEPLFAVLFARDEATRLLGRGEVPARLSAFAAHALGLIGASCEDQVMRSEIVEKLAERLESSRDASDEVEVACAVALGLVPMLPALAGSEPASARAIGASLQAQVHWLCERLREQDRRDRTRAHLPVSLARLTRGQNPDLEEELKQTVCETLLELLADDRPDSGEFVSGCVQALGLLADGDADPLDRRLRELLMEIDELTTDHVSRGLALVALAYAGARPGSAEPGEDAREEVARHLIKALGSGNAITRSWAGLALGVQGRELLDRSEPLPAGSRPALRKILAGAKNPREVGAYCIALGLLRDAEAAPLLRERLVERGDDLVRGHAAVGLGMMGAVAVTADLREVVTSSVYRPALLGEGAIGLGLLGDNQAVPAMIEMLSEANTTFTQASITKALGRIGDRRSVEALLEMLHNETGVPSARSFAAVALGLIGDADPLPWNTPLAVGLNYPASSDTLYDKQGTGILNIL